MAQLDRIASRVEQPPMTDNVADLREYLKKLANIIAMLGKNLEYVINGNIDGTSNIRVNSIQANSMDVQELSAITANLGTMEAGRIYGAYIATTHEGNYPRVEFSDTANIMQAQGDADSSVGIRADFSGTPAVVWQDGAQSASMLLAAGILGLVTFGGADLSISPSGTLHLSAGSGQQVEFDNWYDVYSLGQTQTLGAALDALSARITALGG